MHVLNGINLQVREGERHAIIGPNGAGKTTLFNTITGIYRPRGGKVFFRGKDITGFKPHAINRLGMGRSFQITSTFHRVSAFQNIRIGILSRKGIRFNMFRDLDKMDDITRETEAMLERLNLMEYRDVPADQLSYGKHRSLEIGMALATNPDLVMLDEPAAGISQEETRSTIELIRSLTENKTMVIIEHDMDVVFSLADRITVLHHGEILACGPPGEIKNNQAVKDAYLGETED
ncbi:MAG: ABC transporter ATP-binding protein [bacterium]